MKAFRLSKLSRIDALGIGIAVAASAVFGFAALQPLHSKGKESTTAADAIARERQHLKSLQTAVGTLSVELDCARRQAFPNQVRLQSASNLNARLAELASLANECRLTIRDLKPGENVPTAHYTTVPVLMSGTGNYSDAVALIHQLHQRLADVEVAAFRLTGAADQQPKANCTFDLQLQWRASVDVQSKPPGQSTADLR